MCIGGEAGTMNPGKVKGSRTAMKRGLFAAEVLVDKLDSGAEGE